MYEIQYFKTILYSKTKHIICNLTQFEPLMVWKKFLLGLILLTVSVVMIYTIIGDAISSDPLIKLLVVPKIDNDYHDNIDVSNNSGRLLDLTDFKYIINPACDLGNTTKILLVTSYAGNIESRSALRRAYPASVLSQMGIKRVFLLGILKEDQSEIKQNALINENNRYKDLLQGNFYEAYRNLTYKNVMGLTWASYLQDNCNYSKIKYVLKMDDDIVVDVYKVTNLIENYDVNNVDYDMMGYVLENLRPIRLKANKWYVTKTEFESNTYPKFLSGWFYVIKLDAAKKLVNLSGKVKYFWIDDVYVTGILGNIIDAKYKDIQDIFTLYPEMFECCIRNNISCNIIAGPTGGDNDLQLRYEKHTKSCIEHYCPTILFSKHDCITQRKLPSIGKGFGDIKNVKL